MPFPPYCFYFDKANTEAEVHRSLRKQPAAVILHEIDKLVVQAQLAPFLPGLLTNDPRVDGVRERPVGACLPLSSASPSSFALGPCRYSTGLILTDAMPSPERVTLLPAIRLVFFFLFLNTLGFIENGTLPNVGEDKCCRN